MPRVGFAYDLTGDGKTSIRGRRGHVLRYAAIGRVEQPLCGCDTVQPATYCHRPAGPFSNPLLGQVNPFPAPFPPPGNSVFPLPVLAITYPDDGVYHTPVIYNYNLTVERQVAANWLVRAAYVGSHSSHLAVHLELNPAVYTPGSTLSTDARRLFKNYPVYYACPTRPGTRLTIHSNSVWISGSPATSHLRRTTHFPIAGQRAAKLECDRPWRRRFLHLPWYFNNANFLDRGLSDFDHSHRLVVSWVWQTPHLGGANRWLRGIAGDWQVSGVMQAQTGGPVTILAGQDRSQTNLNRDRAVLTGPALGAGACKNTAPCVDYVNPNSFALPAVGTFGNVGKGAHPRSGSPQFRRGIRQELSLPRSLSRAIAGRVLQSV